MKQFTKVTLALMFLMPLTMTATEQYTKRELAAQTVLLKRMLTACNDKYVYNTTPMHQQDLTSQWYLSYLIPFKLFQMSSCYNAELLLTESKNLSDVIVAMEKLQQVESDNAQINNLIEMLLKCNKAYLQNTPMHEQSLTFQWYLSYLIHFKWAQANSCYNAEVLLAESKKLADVTYNMSQFQQN